MNISINSKYYLPLILLLTAFISFSFLGGFDMDAWDEARNAVNAWEMYHNHDYFNFYFAGELDTWNAKPPLFIWLMVGCAHLFGFNELSMRLPSIISVLLFFIVFFRLVTIFEGKKIAFLSCLVLLSCKAILGVHVTLGADFDSLLLLLLTTAIYYFLRYTEFNENKAAYLMAVFLGLGFYTKGPAVFFIMPGMLIYLLLRGRFIPFIRNYRTWLAMVIFLLIAVSWLYLSAHYGASRHVGLEGWGKSTSLETMLQHDIIERMSPGKFEGRPPETDRLFFFSTMDIRFNLWNYIFYFCILLLLIAFYKERRNPFSLFSGGNNRLELLGLCITITISIVLSVAANPHDWYMAPAFPFIALLIVKGTTYVSKRWSIFPGLCWLLFLVTFTRHVLFIADRPKQLRNTISTNSLIYRQADTLILPPYIRQDALLYMEWTGKKILPVQDTVSDWGRYHGKIIIIEKSSLDRKSVVRQLRPLKYVDKYCIARIR